MLIDHEASIERPLAVDTAQVGLWAFLATVTMLFAGFTSAILVRRTASDWHPIPVPALLWCNTAILLASSLTIEVARRKEAKGWLLATTTLGVLFLMGQIGAWRQLAAAGMFLSGNPHSSFFYILTGAHGLHLLGGLIGLACLLLIPVRRKTVGLWATYWHFLGGLWIYLFVVLFLV